MPRSLQSMVMALALILLPYGVLACAYPIPLQVINTTLGAVHASGGEVGMHHRTRLRRALDQLDVPALRQSLGEVLGRSDRRAADTVLKASAALAGGRGFKLEPDVAEKSRQLASVMQRDCVEGTQAEGQGATDSTAHGARQSERGAASALTFREGITRLSITFTIYLIFLAAVIGLRRDHKLAHAEEDVSEEETPPPPYQGDGAAQL
ncbi:hypothetical protein [Tateyamaria sp. SN3-11]|uniref:hypothetical protein n=1 Tax=Tateyamaria sp. SN3-11 TaxID=3092147 RepID=UPI0039EC0C56